MRSWTHSLAVPVAAFSALLGIAAMVSGAMADADQEKRRRASAAGVGTRRGLARALVPTQGPASGRDCAYYQERDAGAPLGGAFSGGQDDPDAGGTFAAHDSGVFLVEDAAGGRALVWPDPSAVGFVEGWSERPNSDGSPRVVSERALADGAPVELTGPAGSYAQMMAAMGAGAENLPPDVLRALQTRPDLRALPCYWPGPQGLTVREIPSGGPSWGDQPMSSTPQYLFAFGCFVLSALMIFAAVLRVL
ncbi:MAG: hypothetical protein KGM24_02980 [Elusimicrobia bacterium]|nr:hypothetical protein [Elusimicrobiota bacterium]